MSAKVFDIVVAEEYELKDTGEVKTAFHRVGVAFPLKDGGLRCQLPAGIGLTGNFLVFPRKARAEDDGAQGDTGDEIPF